MESLAVLPEEEQWSGRISSLLEVVGQNCLLRLEVGRGERTGWRGWQSHVLVTMRFFLNQNQTTRGTITPSRFRGGMVQVAGQNGLDTTKTESPHTRFKPRRLKVSRDKLGEGIQRNCAGACMQWSQSRSLHSSRHSLASSIYSVARKAVRLGRSYGRIWLGLDQRLARR